LRGIGTREIVMAQIKHIMNDKSYEINTDLGDEITITVKCARTNEVLAEITKPMAEEVISMLESELAQMSIVDAVCILAAPKTKTDKYVPSDAVRILSSKGLKGFVPFSEN